MHTGKGGAHKVRNLRLFFRNFNTKMRDLICLRPMFSQICEKPHFWRTLETEKGGNTRAGKLEAEFLGMYTPRRVI